MIAVRDDHRRIRTYVTSEGSDDSAYRIEHHYDDAGRLRFAFARSGAESGSVVEYRLYFDEWGGVLWRDVRSRGPGYTFLRPPAFPDAAQRSRCAASRERRLVLEPLFETERSGGAAAGPS
jgi:hypothetical protein